MTQTTIATAADYADAMITLRRAKNWLFGILLLILLVQLAIFFTVAYGPEDLATHSAAPAATLQLEAKVDGDSPTTAPIDVAIVTGADADDAAAGRSFGSLVMEWIVGGTTFIGMGAVMVLAVVLVLLLLIMLIGRLIGVSRVTSAFVWCVVLVVLLFPWQAFLNYPGLAGASFRIPGVLMTWAEIAEHARFHESAGLQEAVLKWARFAAFPVVAIILLLLIQTKSKRGLRLALGETDLDADLTGEHETQ